MYPMYDSTMIVLLPALLLAAWAQFRVKSTFDHYSSVGTRRGVTADQVARMLLDRFGLQSVALQRTAGHLTDHYDPRNRTLALSDSVYGSTSIAAIGVAAHEVGHAIQHSEGYAPLTLRNTIVPVVNLTSMAAIPLFFLGFVLQSLGWMQVGIVLFLCVVLFHLITLPVEFNASSRALALLGDTGTLNSDELRGAGKVLGAAAWTYIAAAVMSILQLLRFIIMMNRRSND